ncbi:MAG: ABC transporter substrate-binding protein [Xanthobacteraceae bacterium]|nr:ABC transporter substrate-binding protein [Xanthobacteraceae bacterium]
MRRPLLALILAGVFAPVSAPAQQADNITFAYPNIALTFSASYIAEDRGFYAKNGLNVKGLVIAGPGATNAVISGSADFALASAVVQTRAASKGQRLLSIANPLERPVVQIILRKDLVPSFDPKAPLNDRIRALKGRTIAVDAIGSILHGYPLLLAKRAGLNTETDFRISPMAPLAALAAFKAKQIDGFAMSMPWPIGPVLDGEAVTIASGADGDPADMVPFGMASIITQPAMCEKRKAVCEKMGRSLTEAAIFLRDNPIEAIRILKKRFATLDDQVFAVGFEQIRKATPARPVMVRAALENGERYNVEAGLLKPEDRLKSYEGLYTEAFIP